MLNSHVFQLQNVFMRKQFEELDFTEGGYGELREGVAVSISIRQPSGIVQRLHTPSFS